MKICIIAPVVIPILGREQEYGGTERVVALTSEELVKRGHDVYVFASGDSKTYAKLVATVPEALGLGVSFQKEKEANKRAYEMAVAERPDLIWDHTLALHAQRLLKDRSKFIFKLDTKIDRDKIVDTGDIPVVHTLHWPLSEHVSEIVGALSDAGHFFVSISKDQAKRFLPHLNIKQHLGTVYNAVNLEEFTPDGSEKSEFLFWLGRYSMEKGAHIAIAAAHRLNIPIWLAGKAEEKHEKSYFNKFVKPMLKKKDEILGMVSAEEKYRLLRNAKAVMMTNTWAEPFGIVAAEAMASGTPVVGPGLGSLTELIDQAGILVPVDDLDIDEDASTVTSAQKTYIKRITERMEKLDKIPQSVPRKRAEFLFSPEHNASGYEEAFFKAMYLKRSTG